MKQLFIACLALSLLLSGCNALLDGSYFSANPHQAQETQGNTDNMQAATYAELLTALNQFVENGLENGVIYIPQYGAEKIQTDMTGAVNQLLVTNPIAAYAIESVNWEFGSKNGQSAVSLTIAYTHDRTEIRKIKHVANIDEATAAIYNALNERSPSLVLYVEDYKTTDFVLLAENYAFKNPHMVMESPVTTANIYPRRGQTRVVELKFSYQTSRDTLVTMQEQVTPIFSAAKLYVGGNTAPYQKFTQLYSFLMERHDYTVETSITPAYSLLYHGVGDSKAFSTVFAAMCREAGLECQVISGTRAGHGWYWNLIQLNGEYFHVDLLRSSQLGYFSMLRDNEMTGYVWNYSEYPKTESSPAN